MQALPQRGSSSRLSLAVLRRIGWGLVARRALGRVWSNRTYYELMAELSTAPAVATEIDLAMTARETATFRAFDEALASARGNDVIELRWRARWCADDVRQLYAVSDAHGSILYAQWLIGPEQRARAYGRHLAGARPLAADERIVEAAYTFPAARGRGLMKLGMGRLLMIAREQGASRAWTYVMTDNAASLRGCAAVGFRPAGLRRERLRLGARHAVLLPLDSRSRERWDAVTAARS